MSGDGTDAPQDPNTVAGSVPPPPSDDSAGVPADPPLTEPDLADPNSVVPDFQVPAPPTFGSAPPAPDAGTVIPEPVIPEPVLPPSAVPERVAPPAPQPVSVPPPPAVPPQASVSAPPAQAASGYTDANPYLEPGTAAPNSYRGWTFGIFAGLAVLLIGAIIALIYLFNNAPWEFADAEAPPVIESSAPSAPASVETTEADPVAPASGPCDELCLEMASTVGDSVTGLDGDVTWQLSGAWETADVAVLPAKETAGAEYESSVGTLRFTVWGFEDDAAADDAFATLAEERGEPEATEEVFEGGVGIRNDYRADGSFSVLWSVTGDESRPWVLFVEGPDDDDAVLQFYYSLPI